MPRRLGGLSQPNPKPVAVAATCWALAGCTVLQVAGALGARPDATREAQNAATGDTGCPQYRIKVLFQDYDTSATSVGFTEHLFHLKVCGELKIYRQDLAPPHSYYDATQELRRGICAGRGAPVPPRSSLLNAWAPDRAISDAANDHACPRSQIRILGHGCPIHALDEAFEMEVCGVTRLYRKRVGWVGFSEATNEENSLPCLTVDPGSSPASPRASTGYSAG